MVCVPTQLLELDKLVLYWKCPMRVAFAKLNFEIICSPTFVPASDINSILSLSMSNMQTATNFLSSYCESHMQI